MGLTNREFARHRGVSDAAVNKWRRKEILAILPDGSIDRDASDALLDSRPATYRGGSATRIETIREQAEQVAEDLEQSGGLLTTPEAVRKKENYLAALRQLEYEQKSGALVPLDEVTAAWVNIIMIVKQGVLSLPSKAAPNCLGCKTAAEFEAMLQAECRAILAALSDDLNPVMEPAE